MTENKKSGIGAWVSGLFGFLAGLFIGLVILGWWLWPVEWSNGTMEILAIEQQEDFLRAAMDSYALRPDDALANQRFQSLGESGPYVASEIYADPGDQGTAEIEAFAAAVGATAALENPPEAPPAPVTPEMAFGRLIASPQAAGLCVGVLLILVVIAILLLLRRARDKTAIARAAEAAPTLKAETVSEDTAPVVVAAVAASEAGDALPDWVLEAAPEGYEPVELPEGGEQAVLDEFPEEFDLLGGEEEQTLSDEDIAEITSSRFGQLDDEDEGLPDFLKEALPAAAVAGAGAAAAAAFMEGEEEVDVEEEVEAEVAAAAEAVEELPLEEEEFDLVAAAAAFEATGEAEGETGEEAEIEETPEEMHAKFSQDIQTVEGIGPVYAEKLRSIGISAPLLLLRNGATTKGRQQIAESTGISEKLILKWVNYVDLFRIKGVGQEYAELLEAAGVDTVPELAMRNPVNLHQKMLEVAEEKQIVRRPPALSLVKDWVEQAKKLPRAIYY